MSTARIMACALLLFGVALHTYTNLVKFESFSPGWWLWALAPYIAGALLLGLLKRPHAAAGALLVPAIMDAGNFYSVFVHPMSSTAGLGMIFVPLWNLAVFVPLGGALGWWIGRRVSLKAADMPSN
jgi:hypothetical protein